MQNIITNYGKNIALSELQNKINKYVLIGANTSDDVNLDKLLSTNLDILTDYNIDTATNDLIHYIITDIKDINNSLIDKDKRLVFTIHIAPNDLPEKKYIYAIALLDNDKNIYSINRISQTFNSIKDAGEIITIKHTILSDEIQERGQLLQIFDKAGDFVSRDEFIFWLENHNHDDATVSLKKFTDTITKINANKVDINTLGNIDLVNSADNSNVVNILNEIIYNIGTIPNLSDGKYTNLVEAINDVIGKIGKSEKLTFIANDIYDALNALYKEINNLKNVKFSDDVSVSKVRWDDKANITYIGSLDNFRGDTRSNIVEAINETYDKVVTNDKIDRFIMPYDNTKTYKKYDICYLKVFYNNKFYLVELMWINDTNSNKIPFIEKENIINTKFNYLQNSTILEIDTPNNILYDSLESDYWKILNKDFQLNTIETYKTQEITTGTHTIDNVFNYDLNLINGWLLPLVFNKEIINYNILDTSKIIITLMSNTSIEISTTNKTQTFLLTQIKFK